MNAPSRILVVKVTPNASKSVILGFQEGILKVKIQAPPDKGKANDALIAFLAEVLKVAKSDLTLLSGHTSRIKKIQCSNRVDLSKLQSL